LFFFRHVFGRELRNLGEVVRSKRETPMQTVPMRNFATAKTVKNRGGNAFATRMSIMPALAGSGKGTIKRLD
jgi:hypothetical protein